MSYQGHCLCGNITVSLPQQPANSARCYCSNCARSGGGSSIVYFVDDAEVSIHDPKSYMKAYEDTNTASGNRLIRNFCSNCASPITSITPMYAGKTLVKAPLFDVIAPPSLEVFTGNRQGWMSAVEGAQQE